MTFVDLTPKTLRELRIARVHRQRWCLGLTSYGAALVAGWLVIGGQPQGLHAAQSAVSEQSEQRELAIKRLAAAQKQVLSASRSVDAAKIVRSFPDWSPVLIEIASRRGSDIVLDRCEIRPVTVAEAPGIPSFAKLLKPASDKAPACNVALGNVMGYRIVIGGVAPNPSSVADFVLQLQNADMFDAVSQMEMRGRTVRTAEAVGFTVECVLTEGKINP